MWIHYTYSTENTFDHLEQRALTIVNISREKTADVSDTHNSLGSNVRTTALRYYNSFLYFAPRHFAIGIHCRKLWRCGVHAIVAVASGGGKKERRDDDDSKGGGGRRACLGGGGGVVTSQICYTVRPVANFGWCSAHGRQLVPTHAQLLRSRPVRAHVVCRSSRSVRLFNFFFRIKTRSIRFCAFYTISAELTLLSIILWNE